MNNVIVYELVYHAVLKKTGEEKPQGRDKQTGLRGENAFRPRQENALLLTLYC